MSSPWSSTSSTSSSSWVCERMPPGLVSYYANRRFGLVEALPYSSWGPESQTRRGYLKDIEECVVSGKIDFRKVDWNPPKREGRGGESPNISPKGFTALINGIEKPIPIGKVVGRQKEVGKKRRSEEVQGKQAWRPPGRC